MVEVDGWGVGVVQSGLKVVKSAGVGGLWCGINANLWKLSPSIGVSHLVYHGVVGVAVGAAVAAGERS